VIPVADRLVVKSKSSLKNVQLLNFSSRKSSSVVKLHSLSDIYHVSLQISKYYTQVESCGIKVLASLVSRAILARSKELFLLPQIPSPSELR
jgi:hypothetical protein